MDITNIFCQPLGVTSHAKFAVFERIWYLFERLRLSVQKKKLSSVRTTWAIRLKKVVIRSNCLGCPFEKSCHPFERLGISV